LLSPKLRKNLAQSYDHLLLGLPLWQPERKLAAMRILLVFLLFGFAVFSALAQPVDQIAFNGNLIEANVLKIDSGRVLFLQQGVKQSLPLRQIDFIIIGFSPKATKIKASDSLFAPYVLNAEEALAVISSKPLSYNMDFHSHKNIVDNQFYYSQEDFLGFALNARKRGKHKKTAGICLFAGGVAGTLLVQTKWKAIPAIMGSVLGVTFFLDGRKETKRSIIYQGLAESPEQ